MKIKIIDLLNMISKKEEVPKIKIDGKVYNFCTTCFANNESKELIWNFPIDTLNDELEVLEEDKEIEKINSIKVPTISNSREKNIENIEETLNKYWFVINKLTEAVNELKKGK